jgi:hypothetical protein
VLSSYTQVWHGSHLMRIIDQLESLSRQLGLILHEKANLLPRAISGGIIDEYYMVVGVVLHEYAAHIFEMTLLGHIVVAGHHHAEGQFLELANIVFLLVVSPLLFSYSRILPVDLLLVHREMPSLHCLYLGAGNASNGTGVASGRVHPRWWKVSQFLSCFRCLMIVGVALMQNRILRGGVSSIGLYRCRLMYSLIPAPFRAESRATTDGLALMTHDILQFLLLHPQLHQPLIIVIGSVGCPDLQHDHQDQQSRSHHEVEDAVLLEMEQETDQLFLQGVLG